MSTFRKLLSVNSIVGVALIFGLINNIAITGMFGLSVEVDAYFASSMLVTLFMNLVVHFLGKNFLPVFAIRRQQSLEEASRLASLVVTQFGIMAAVASLLLIWTSGTLFSLLLPGFDEFGLSTTATTFSIMAPSIFLITVNVFHEYVWQHDEHYDRVVFSKLFAPITLTVFILGFGWMLGTRALPIGFLCGNIVTTIFLLYKLPYRFRFRIEPKNPDFLKIIRNSSVLMTTGLISRSRGIIIQYFASQIGEGAISAIAIARKICLPVFQNALLGVRMILFSRSAKAMAQSDLKAFARMHNLALMGVFFLTTPIAFWYAFDGDLIVRAVFQRGAFTDDMVILVYSALIGLAGSVVFSGVEQMLSNAFYALDRIRVPAVVMPLGTVLYLFIVMYLAPRYGVLGMTASTSIVSVVNVVILLLLLRRVIPGLAVTKIVFAFARYLAVASVAIMAALYVGNTVEMDKMTGFIVSMLVVGVTYVAISLLIRDYFMLQMIEKSGIKNIARR